MEDTTCLASGLIGDKAYFAIEYAISPKKPSSDYVFGYMRIWLNNIYYGTYEDENILGVAIGCLEHILKSYIGGSIFDALSDDEIFNYVFYGGEIITDRYRLILGEMTDDFSALVFKQGEDDFKFIWRLHEKPYFTYDDYPPGVHSAIVNINIFEQVVSEYAEVVSRYKAKFRE